MPELAFKRYIFEIGIYLKSPDKFYNERQKELNDLLSWITRQSGGLTKAEVPDVFAMAEHHFINKYGGWRYTQAVGWLRLYILGTQIRGETWFVDAKRINRRMKQRKFVEYGKAFELDIEDENAPSLDIYKQILDELNHLVKEAPYKGRYLDLEAFKNIGLFVNWRQIIGFDQ